MKVIACLGNPGSEYSTTRHNVGWWLADRLAESWNLGRFKRNGPVSVAEGRIEGARARVVKPLSYMNRSGPALVAHLRGVELDLASDLLVVVDDVALEPGRARPPRPRFDRPRPLRPCSRASGSWATWPRPSSVA